MFWDLLTFRCLHVNIRSCIFHIWNFVKCEIKMRCKNWYDTFSFMTSTYPYNAMYRVSHNYLDWAKYQNRHSSKSIWVMKLFFCQNAPLIRQSFWHSYTFWTMPILIFSPVQIIMGHPLCSTSIYYVHCFHVVDCYTNNLYKEEWRLWLSSN